MNYIPRPICVKFDTGDVHNNVQSEFYFHENRHNEVVLCSEAYMKVCRLL